MLPELTSMLNPWQWAVLALIPPALVALYFLKLKREPLEVPSTYLWHKSIEDLHVNSLWQRLRSSLLLWLQLLLLLLLVLALWNPSWRGSRLAHQRIVILIDNSAGMQTADGDPRGATRLEVAKRRAAELIDAMSGGDVAALISFSDTARVVQEPTGNRALLRRRLAEIEPTARGTQLDDALRVAAALTQSGGEDAAAELIVFSDFRLPPVADFSLGMLTPRFEMVGDPGSGNVGIVAFATRRLDDRPDVVRCFVRIGNFSDRERTVRAALRLNDALLDAQDIVLPAGESRGPPLPFELPGLDEGVLELTIDTEDPFPLDDTAWAVVNPPRRSRVLLVTPHNPNLRRALETTRAAELAEVTVADPAVLETEEHLRQARGGWYDLIIYDRCAPREMPACNTLFVGSLPGEGGWDYGDDIELPLVIDTQRAHPLMQLLELGDVAIFHARQLQPPLGAATLIDSQAGPIFAIAPRGSYEDAVLGFEFIGRDAEGRPTYNTNWPLRRSFPVFIHEVLAYLGGGRHGPETTSLRPGESYLYKSIADPEQIEVVAPDGARQRLSPIRESEFAVAGGEQLGVYEIREGPRVARRFAVNLLNARESDIRPQPGEAVFVGETAVEVQHSPGRQFSVHRIWRPLLLLGLAVLLLEWYIYNRRVYL